MKRLELASRTKMTNYAYAISRVEKNKCRVKWTNKSQPGGNIGGVISENL